MISNLFLIKALPPHSSGPSHLPLNCDQTPGWHGDWGWSSVHLFPSPSPALPDPRPGSGHKPVAGLCRRPWPGRANNFHGWEKGRSWGWSDSRGPGPTLAFRRQRGPEAHDCVGKGRWGPLPDWGQEAADMLPPVMRKRPCLSFSGTRGYLKVVKKLNFCFCALWSKMCLCYK